MRLVVAAGIIMIGVLEPLLLALLIGSNLACAVGINSLDLPAEIQNSGLQTHPHTIDKSF